MPVKRIETITLSNLLPLVFRGMEDAERIRRSEVWLAGDVRLERGCRLCIQAESGSGKSSLLSFIYGNRNDYQGGIFFTPSAGGDECDVRTLSIAQWCELRMRHLALLPQEMRLFPELSVMQNLQLKNRLTAHKTDAQLLSMLDRMGIADKADRPVALLSIGQQQRVAIIRALCQPFDFIMLDEPVSHLDEANNREAAAMVSDEAAAQGAGIISTSVGNPLLLQKVSHLSL